MQLLKPGYLIISLLLLAACGEDVGSNRFDRPAEVEEQNENPVDLPQEFRTRLDNNLLISGVRCVGGETTEDEQNQTFTCLRNQFLITLDDINICDAADCTEIIVDPIIAELQLVEEEDDRSEQFDFFHMNPISPASAEQIRILNEVEVRADNNGAQVAFRFPIPTDR